MNIIKALCHQGQRKIGVEKGADILEAIIKKNKYPLSIDVIDTHKFNSLEGYKELFEKHKKYKNLVVTLGGDHSIGRSTVGSSIAKYGNDLTVIWVDAHADIHTKETSISKNTHGMPLSTFFNLEHNEISQNNLHLTPNDLVYFGIRDLDPPEIKFIEKLKIKYFNNIESILDHLKSNTKKNVHISFDVDSLDPKYLDSTGTIAPNGIKPSDYIQLHNYVHRKLVGWDIVEFNPELGDKEKSKETMEYIIGNLII